MIRTTGPLPLLLPASSPHEIGKTAISRGKLLEQISQAPDGSRTAELRSGFPQVGQIDSAALAVGGVLGAEHRVSEPELALFFQINNDLKPRISLITRIKRKIVNSKS